MLQRVELAAHLVALMEHGAQLKPAGSGATWWPANAPPAPPPEAEHVVTDEELRLQRLGLARAIARGEGPPGSAHLRETGAEAIEAARDAVIVPGPSVAEVVKVAAGYRVAVLPRWSDERKARVFRAMAQHAAPWHGVRWATLARELSDLPGPGISGMGLRDWWIKTGAAQAARGDAPEAVAAT